MTQMAYSVACDYGSRPAQKEEVSQQADSRHMRGGRGVGSHPATFVGSVERGPPIRKIAVEVQSSKGSPATSRARHEMTLAPSISRPAADPIHFRNEMISRQAARSMLNLVRLESVDEMIEAGQLCWAWNFARRGSRHRLIRVLKASVTAFRQSRRQPDFFGDELALHVVGPARPTVSGIALAACFAVSTDHAVNLVRDGDLKTAPGFPGRRGRDGTARIIWSSAVEFLKRRRINA